MSKSKKKNNRANKPEKKRIITQKRVNIAILVIIAVAIITSLFVKYAVPRIKDAVSHNEGAQLDNNYEFVKYGKGEIPSDFAKILKSAEADEAAACKEYGTVLTIGDRKISYSTLLMYYVDKYNYHLGIAAEDISRYGYSTEDFALQYYPEFKDITEEKNWAEQLTEEVCEETAQNYYLFDMALKEKFKPTEKEIRSILSRYESIRSQIVASGASAEALLEKNYTKGVTMDIYCANQIIIGYAECYKSHLQQDISKKIRDKDLKEYINGKESDYQVFCGRIYPLTGNTDIKDVKTEEDLLAFAAKDHSNVENYNADESTDATFATYEAVSSAYGPIVADYVFSSDRKAGEISTVTNEVYSFLVYVEKPAYFETSVSCVLYFKTFSSEDEETRAAQEQEIKDYYNEWVQNEADKNALKQQCDSNPNEYDNLPYGDIEMRVNSFDTVVDYWLRDPARKRGDHEIFVLDNVVAIVYYEKTNSNDFDWEETVKNEIADEKISTDYSYSGSVDYTVNIDKEKISKVYSAAHGPINNLVGLVIGTN